MTSKVVEIGLGLMLVAAIFQLFDGLQAVTTGALRGLGDTQRPMIWNFVGHWTIGLPIAYWLCFVMGRGVIGLWSELSNRSHHLRRGAARGLRANAGTEAADARVKV